MHSPWTSKLNIEQQYNRLTLHFYRAKLLRSEILLYTNPLLVIFFHILPVTLTGGMVPTSWILQIVVLVPRDQQSNVSYTSLYHSVLCKVCIPSQLQNQNYMDATQACKVFLQREIWYIGLCLEIRHSVDCQTDFGTHDIHFFRNLLLEVESRINPNLLNSWLLVS